VRVEAPDLAAYPAFAAATYAELVLAPGDVLFIPAGHWHYVRSLETSFSVSFWWGAKMALSLRADGCVEARY
jgi:lysine-specific demethylase 8